METQIETRDKAAKARRDVELVTSAQAGDVTAFEALLRQYHGLVYALAYARLNDRDAAEDLVQEVFLRVFLNLKDLHQPQFFSAWLTRVTRNLAMDWVRRGQRRSMLTPMVSLEANAQEAQMVMGTDLREAVQSRQDNEMLEAAMQSLSFDQRELVLLYYAEDCTHDEIARRLGMHPATVGRQLKRSLEALKSRLEPTLRGAHRAEWRARPESVARTLAIVTVAAALSGTSKAALAATAGAMNAGTGHSAGALAGHGMFGIVQGVVIWFTAGGKAMATGKIMAAGAALIIAGLGGVKYYNNKDAVAAPPTAVSGPAALSAGTSSKAAAKSFASGGDVEGIWMGSMKTPTQGDLRMVFQVRREANGSISATLDSPDQGVGGLPVSDAVVNGDNIELPVKMIEGKFTGKRDHNDQISGHWKQGPVRFPLVLNRTAAAPVIPTPVPRKEAAINPAVLDNYIGQYALAPNMSIVISREGDKLLAQVTGQPKLVIHPESETKFFYTEVDAQLTFIKGADGLVEKLLLDQSKVTLPAKKIR